MGVARTPRRTGIFFRVTVHVLARLLLLHAATSKSFRITLGRSYPRRKRSCVKEHDSRHVESNERSRRKKACVYRPHVLFPRLLRRDWQLPHRELSLCSTCHCLACVNVLYPPSLSPFSSLLLFISRKLRRRERTCDVAESAHTPRKVRFSNVNSTNAVN